MGVVLNLLLYQAGWAACVLGAARGAPWLGVAAAVAIVSLHLANAREPRREARLIAGAVAAGAAFETLLVQAHLLRYPNGVLIEGTAPLWMLALWAMFATTLNVSLRSLRGRPWLAAILGAVGAPLAYYAGERMGALQLGDKYFALGMIAVGWAWATPLLLAAARRHDGFAPA